MMAMAMGMSKTKNFLRKITTMHVCYAIPAQLRHEMTKFGVDMRTGTACNKF